MLCHGAHFVSTSISVSIYNDINYPANGGPWGCTTLQAYGTQLVKDIRLIITSTISDIIFKIQKGKE